MRYIAVLILLLAPLTGHAQDWEDQQVFGSPNPTSTLRILSSTDTSFFAPIIQASL